MVTSGATNKRKQNKNRKASVPNSNAPETQVHTLVDDVMYTFIFYIPDPLGFPLRQPKLVG